MSVQLENNARQPDPERSIEISFVEGGPICRVRGMASEADSFCSRLATLPAEPLVAVNKLLAAFPDRDSISEYDFKPGSGFLYWALRNIDTIALCGNPQQLSWLSANIACAVAYSLYAPRYRDEVLYSSMAFHVAALLTVRQELEGSGRLVGLAAEMLDRQLRIAVTTIDSAGTRRAVEPKATFERSLLVQQSDRNVGRQIAYLLGNWQRFVEPHSSDGLTIEVAKAAQSNAEALIAESYNVVEEKSMEATIRAACNRARGFLEPTTERDREVWGAPIREVDRLLTTRTPRLIDLAFEEVSHPRAPAKYLRDSRSFQREALSLIASRGPSVWLLTSTEGLMPFAHSLLVDDLRKHSAVTFDRRVRSYMVSSAPGSADSLATILEAPVTGAHAELLQAELQFVADLKAITRRHGQSLVCPGDSESPNRLAKALLDTRPETVVTLSFSRHDFSAPRLMSLGIQRERVLAISQRAAGRMWEGFDFLYRDQKVAFGCVLEHMVNQIAEEGTNARGWGSHNSIAIDIKRIRERGLSLSSGETLPDILFTRFPLSFDAMKAPSEDQFRDLVIFSRTSRGNDPGSEEETSAPRSPASVCGPLGIVR